MMVTCMSILLRRVS